MDENIVKSCPLKLIWGLFVWKRKLIDRYFFCKPCIINKGCFSRNKSKTGHWDVAEYIFTRTVLKNEFLNRYVLYMEGNSLKVKPRTSLLLAYMVHNVLCTLYNIMHAQQIVCLFDYLIIQVCGLSLHSVRVIFIIC